MQKERDEYANTISTTAEEERMVSFDLMRKTYNLIKFRKPRNKYQP
jgi:hypothetical protein